MGGFSDSVAMEVAPFGVRVCTLEPGGFRTNWLARAEEGRQALLPEYEPTVGALYTLLEKYRGQQEGDPRRIADLVVRLPNSAELPKRLILGVDAEARVHSAEEARAQEAKLWEEWTHSTVYPDFERMPELSR